MTESPSRPPDAPTRPDADADGFEMDSSGAPIVNPDRPPLPPAATLVANGLPPTESVFERPIVSDAADEPFDDPQIDDQPEIADEPEIGDEPADEYRSDDDQADTELLDEPEAETEAEIPSFEDEDIDQDIDEDIDEDIDANAAVDEDAQEPPLPDEAAADDEDAEEPPLADEAAADDEDAGARDGGLAARATVPELGALELRQVAGLTSGTTMPLEPNLYDFSEDDDTIGFQIEIDSNDRAVVIPGTATAKIDANPIDGPTVLGSGCLDVGSARFLVRHRRERRRPTDWLDQHDASDRPEPLIQVPDDLGAVVDASPKPARRRRWHRRRDDETPADAAPALDATSWEFIERIRAVRIELADRERSIHPDPAELADRARHRAPILGIRPPGHPLFAKVGVLVADMPWMPRFDDLSRIPESLGAHLKPLMSLPSLPIAADLMVGPLGIVGSRSAAMACARHILVSLYGLSNSDLHLHVVAGDDRVEAWDWSLDITPPRSLDLDGGGFPVVFVDGMEQFERSGLDHQDAIDHRAGVVILADSVEDLPAYCGTVLQVDRAGGGLLTNHLGHIISGTPIGLTAAYAATVADDLFRAMARRHNR